MRKKDVFNILDEQIARRVDKNINKVDVVDEFLNNLEEEEKNIIKYRQYFRLCKEVVNDQSSVIDKLESRCCMLKSIVIFLALLLITIVYNL